MKLDLKKELDAYRARQGELRDVDVPPLRYLMVDGRGDPNTSQEYADALAALYPVAYSVKFASLRELDRDYVVMPLEALWWADDLSSFTSERDTSRWSWTVMVLTPDWIPDPLLASCLDAGSDRVRVETLAEGRCVQTLHVGSYDDEGPVIERLHAFAAESGLALTGTHHEIYLSDPRRVAPEKLRTILRQPVSPPAGG